MLRSVVYVLGASALFATTSPGFAQSSVSGGSVVSVCAEVVAAEKLEESQLRGQCIQATAAYLGSLRSNGTPPTVFDQSISDLVVALTELLFVPDCLPESEVAQAIALANAQVANPAQMAQIRLIYQTVVSCDFGITAAITPLPNTFSAESRSDGTRASDS